MPPSDHMPIPLTVIGGFLGAGKTTYLNALIREGITGNTLIVVNDFGDINIDAELIDYRDDRILQLSNGCICCTLGGTLAEQLAAVLRLHSHPEAVFIEASGVADPGRIGDIARVSRRFELAAVTCLVDGSQALRHAADPLTGDIWRAQVSAASQLLLNRMPTEGEGERAAVTDLLARLNPVVTPGVVGMEGCPKLPTKPMAMAQGSAGIRHRVTPLRGTFRSASLSMPAPVDAGWLEALLGDYGDVLLRAKGFLARHDRSAIQVLQFSGGKINWQPAIRTPGSCQLVCIGGAGERFDALIGCLQQQSAEAFVPSVRDEAANL